jgi:hypothetical protein
MKAYYAKNKQMYVAIYKNQYVYGYTLYGAIERLLKLIK